jgi:acyl-CoA oxidase
VLYQLLAKALLSGYKEEFDEVGVIHILRKRAGRILKAMNPVAARRDDEDHLRDPRQQLDLLRYREERILDSAARRLRAGLKKDPVRAMHDVQDHLMHLATAHVERVAFEAVQESISRAGPQLAPVLGLLRDTFWATRVEADLGWYLMSGVVETPKAKGIRYLANKCCQELRPIAEEITEGFGIPDAVLAAPIAFEK